MLSFKMKVFQRINKQLLIICILFTFTISSNTSPFTINDKEEFAEKCIKPYFHATVIGDDDNINYVISVYHDENKEERYQLGQSYNGHAFVVDKVEEGETVYWTLECSSYPCSGVLNYGSTDSVVLNEGIYFSFYVPTGQNENKWTFTLNTTSSNANVWVRGHKSIITELVGPDAKNITKKDNYYIVLEPMKETARLVINAECGDYINIGVNGLELEDSQKSSYLSSTDIVVNGPAITGYLRHDTVDEICYTLRFDSKYKMENNIKVFGTGTIITKIAYAYIKYNGEKKSEDDKETLFPNGQISNTFISQELQGHSLCVNFPNHLTRFDFVEDIVFTYQLVMDTSLNNGLNLFDPQIKGIFYPRMITKDSQVAFLAHSFDFNHNEESKKHEKMTLNMIARDGFPEMYVVECDNYPFCDLSNLEGKIKPKIINRIATYTYDQSLESYCPIGKQQTLLVTKCESYKNPYGTSGKKKFDEFCIFESLIFDDDDAIEVLEDDYFNQYLLKDEVHNYKIIVGNENLIEKIFIDVMTFVGDVEVKVTSDIESTEYFAINKIYISVKTRVAKGELYEINFSVKALKNSFYSILVNFGRDETVEKESLISNQLQTGMSYLVTIDTTQVDYYGETNKIVKIRNERSYNSEDVMVNFKTVNCLIDVYHTYDLTDQKPKYTDEEKFKVNDVFGFLTQDVTHPQDEEYKKKELDYRIKVTKNDYSQYKGKLCKIYVSSTELTKEHEENRDILIPDDTPQQIMFGKEVHHISYGYVHVNFDKELVIKFTPKHKAKYNVNVYYDDSQTPGDIINVVSKKIVEIDPTEGENRCNSTARVCYIQIDITVDGAYQDENTVLELSIKSIESTPVSYITKNYLITDYLQNNKPQYYYTELGEKENGFVVINFHRGSGDVFGKIVKKDGEPEEEADWKKYKLPTVMWATKKSDSFKKQFDFNTYEKDCKNGCFLLLLVMSDVDAEKISILRNYPYTLLVHSYSTDLPHSQMPVMTIPLEEYVIGSVKKTEDYIYNYYYVLIPSDADKVIIDFQSETAGLYIEVGEELPSVDHKDFYFHPRGKESIFNITKEDILKELGQGHNSIKNVGLTIGVWTNMVDSIDASTYALAVRLEETKQVIYRVNSDQKTTCKPELVENPQSQKASFYRCLFVVEYIFIHKYPTLSLYATPHDLSASVNIYAKPITPEEYELGNINEESIPTENSHEYESDREYKDYLYVNAQINNEKYLLVSVECTEDTLIDFYSSINLFGNGITPNPSSPQLFSTLTNFEFNLQFPSEYMVMANIIGIFGSAELSWKGDSGKYFLKGRDDRISITSSKEKETHELVVKTRDNIKDGNGFIFLVSYHIRNKNANVDPLNLYKSVNYVYRDNDLPVIYYTPISTLKMEENDYYEVSFTFDDLENKEAKERTYYQNVPFEVNGYILKESYVYQLKASPDILIISKQSIKGVYDQAVRTGLIRISKSDIENTDIPKEERPFLYIAIDKTDEFKDVRYYNKIGVETNVIRSHSEIPVSEKSNHFGFITSGEKKYYSLKTNTKFKYMNIQFSCVEENLSISIEGTKGNLVKGDFKYGKTFYSVSMDSEENDKVNLIIENTKNTDEYFMFRYAFSDEQFNKDEFTFSGKSELTVKTEKQKSGDSSYVITLSPVKKNEKKNFNVTYMVRLIDDKKPTRADISMKIKNQVVKEYYDPQKSGDFLLLNVYNISLSIQYIQVIAQVREEEDIQYLSYDLYNISGNSANGGSSSKPSSSNKTLIIVIVVGALLFVIVVVLIVVIVVFNNKNKDLLDKVNKVSFADAQDQNGDDNDLLAPIN